MNVGKVLKETVEKFGDKPFIFFKDKTITFAEMEKRVNKFANALLRLGLQKGNHIGVILPNCPEYAIAYLSIYKIGATIIPIDFWLKEEEKLGIISHAKIKFLITEALTDSFLEKLKEKVSSLEKIISRQKVSTILSWEEIVEKESDKLTPGEIKDEDISTIYYTSGTTGVPKGIVWNYRHLDNAAMIMNYFCDVGEKDVDICPIPLSHAGGSVPLFTHLEYGGSIVLMEKFQPLEFLKNVQKYKVTWSNIVPSMFAAIVHLKDFEKYDLSSIRFFASFGAPGAPELLEKFHRQCPNGEVWSGYGLMETAPPNTVPPIGKAKRGSVGMAPPWIQVKIFDENSREVETGNVGEVVIKGWVVMNGYYKQPELTAQVIKNGWFHTGDLGKLDEDGYLYIVGRKKEVIIVGGLNVHAVEVENVISQHPRVLEVAVIGIPDKMRGEVVKAFIILKPGEKVDKQEILDFCRLHLTHFKVPKGIEFRDSFPRTSVGKIKKSVLK